ncbi:hypothetical protein ACSDR0_24665 [Streptosporangium sp. G11]|uniref:hypothetical protein n=1 Tax=Streptosporangium sp. G11 TaxID=3436926 RepID=UPI003EB6ECEB
MFFEEKMILLSGDAHGGGMSRGSVIERISWANGLPANRTHSEHAGRALFSAVADLSGMTGWTSYDADTCQDAARHLALQATKESDRLRLRRVGHWTSNPTVAGSNPAGCATETRSSTR